MSRLRIKIDYGYATTLLDLTIEEMEKDVAQNIVTDVLEKLALATKHVTRESEDLV